MATPAAAEAAAAPSLGDFFAKKNKKKVKTVNLNNPASTAKPEPSKKKKEDEDTIGWKEEEIALPTVKAGIEVGKLLRDEDDDKDEQQTGPVWGKPAGGGRSEPKRSERDEKRFPDLSAAMGFRASSNINIDDGKDDKVNIQTSKNAFSALEDEEDDEGGGGKRRPKDIKPAMVSKSKGEREKDVVAREVEKHGGLKKKEKDSMEIKEEAEKEKRRVEKKAEKDEKRRDRIAAGENDKENEDVSDDEPEQPKAADTMIKVDEEAARAKYKGRKHLPLVDLDRAELEDPNKVQKKPKKKFVDVEDKKKQQFLQDDDF